MPKAQRQPTEPATASRSLFNRLRIVLAVLAVLVAFDVGLALQINWARRDHEALITRRVQEIRAALDDVDVQRDAASQLSRRADEVVQQKLRQYPKPDDQPKPADAGKPPAAPSTPPTDAK